MHRGVLLEHDPLHQHGRGRAGSRRSCTAIVTKGSNGNHKLSGRTEQRLRHSQPELEALWRMAASWRQSPVKECGGEGVPCRAVVLGLNGQQAERGMCDGKWNRLPDNLVDRGDSASLSCSSSASVLLVLASCPCGSCDVKVMQQQHYLTTVRAIHDTVLPRLKAFRWLFMPPSRNSDAPDRWSCQSYGRALQYFAFAPAPGRARPSSRRPWAGSQATA